jgi:hypothetical protein
MKQTDGLRNQLGNVFLCDGTVFLRHRWCLGLLGPEKSWRAAAKRERLSKTAL